MATAPVVQSLSDVYNELNNAYQGGRDVINEQMSGLGEKYDAQHSALDAKKVQGFDTINDQATGRGMAFSGIPLDEQAKYLSTEYLPGMQQLSYQQNAETLTMKGQLADIDKEQRLGAMSRIDQQQSALNQWNLTQLQIQTQAAEAEKQRAWQAEQNRLDQQFQASQNAANRAASSAGGRGGGGGSGSTVAQDWAARVGAVATVKGGYVSSSNWKALSREFVAGGYGTYSDFQNRFKNYVEPSQWKTYR